MLYLVLNDYYYVNNANLQTVAPVSARLKPSIPRLKDFCVSVPH